MNHMIVLVTNHIKRSRLVCDMTIHAEVSSPNRPGKDITMSRPIMQPCNHAIILGQKVCPTYHVHGLKS